MPKQNLWYILTFRQQNVSEISLDSSKPFWFPSQCKQQLLKNNRILNNLVIWLCEFFTVYKGKNSKYFYSLADLSLILKFKLYKVSYSLIYLVNYQHINIH